MFHDYVHFFINIIIAFDSKFQDFTKKILHKRFIVDNIPYSLIVRIRRICSNYENYRHHCSILLKHLLNRGYNHKIIIKTIHEVSKIDRLDLIAYKPKKTILNNYSNELFPTVITFDRKFNDYYNEINNYWINHFQEIEKFKDKNIKLKLSFKVLNNLHLLLMMNKRVKNNKYIKCEDILCKTCKFANTDSLLYNNKNIPILLATRSSCDSNSHSRLKMSVDSESTHQNTSRMMHKNILSF
jgi:hypothetical protein